MTPAHPSRALVVGVGNPDRGDDAVGAQVASAVAALDLPGVDVMTREDPTDLVQLWSGHELVVVVDAVVSGAAPGTVTLTPADEVEALAARTGPAGGTHTFGVAEAVGLAGALGTLPARLRLVGVEAAGFDHGEPLSESVAAAVPVAVEAVSRIVGPDRALHDATSGGRA